MIVAPGSSFRTGSAQLGWPAIVWQQHPLHSHRLSAARTAHHPCAALLSGWRWQPLDGEQLEEFIRDRAWGHHASCTCKIGDPKTGGVLSSDFKVHGTAGLRVVDASVFPRIPGFFIASAVYMIGEKAAAVIATEAKTATALGTVKPFTR